MNKTIKRVMSLALVLVMCLALSAQAWAFTYTPVTGTEENKVSFKKYLVMESTANVPNVTFSFTIAAGTPVTENGFEVYAGPMTPAPTITWATGGANGAQFTSGSTTYTAKESGDSSVQLETDQKYAKDTATVSFNGVKFPEPGVYRYVITETVPSTPAGFTAHNNVTTLYLDVYVKDTEAETPALSIEGYSLYTAEAVDGIKIPVDEDKSIGEAYEGVTKADGLQNDYATYDLTIGKNVSGNKASRDKYFKVSVTLPAKYAGTYFVDLSNAENAVPAAGSLNSATDSNYAGQTNYTSNTDGTTVTFAEDTYKVDFYLQHNQTITIKDLPAGATYTVTETPEDYKPSYDVVKVGTGENGADTPFTSGTTASYEGPGLTADTKVTFTNTRQGVIPTGVLLTIAPFVGLMLAGLIGATVILKKKHA